MTLTPPLPRSTPESEGIPSSAILDFVSAADIRLENLHSFMLLRHGRVVSEAWWHPYAPAHPHSMYSVSKSFTAMAVGLAISEGLLTLDDRVPSLLPEDLPAAVSDNLAAMTVRHLLTMTTGHDVDTIWIPQPADGNLSRNILAYPVEFTPGTHFVYNSGASYLLSAIVHRLTGQRLLHYLTPRLLEPLGIADATWETCPRGIDTGGWGLSITTEDLAAFTQFCLQRGEWNGRQLVPAEWIDAAGAKQVDTAGTDHKLDGQQGYGYHFWRNSRGGYRADGAFGQFGLILPEHDAVIVITAGVQESQDVLDLVWQHLVPAFGTTPLAASPDHDQLAEKTGSLSIPPSAGAADSPTASRVHGIRWALDDSEYTAATVESGRLTMVREGVEQSFAVGHGEWAITEDAQVAASGGWTSADAYLVRECRYETPFVHTLTFVFHEDRVTLTVEENAAFDETGKTRVIEGRVAS